MSGDTSPASDPAFQPDPESSAPEAATPPPASADHPEVAADSGEAPAAGATGSEADGRMASLEHELEQLRGQYMRIAADFDNFRKRQSREQEEMRLQITRSTLREILPVVDNFDRARSQLKPEGEEARSLYHSYQGLYKQLVEVLKQLGVSPMRAEGEPFDPNIHEAVLREESHEHPEDIVIEELQRGYHLHGTVLRHAMVKVSVGPGPAPGAEPQSAEQDG
ncbi:MAG: nucleotide exchange factor GrpE [Synechococcaceae cyanobacterium]|nr:nucleotide exchange factor GrpE [Synechococcaceae cyanobacterium]